MTRQMIFDELCEAVLSFDAGEVMEITRKALTQGVDPVSIIDKGLAEGLKIVGNRFEDGEFFLMHLVAAGEAAQKALKELIEPEIKRSKKERKSLGKIVIGTVAGDIHDIGKNIVASLLFSAGFDVYDLGKDVPVQEFVKKAKDVDADVVAASALLSTSIPVQREIIEALVKDGIRDDLKVIVGGAPVTEEWARSIGADGYGESAVEAVRVTKKLLNIPDQVSVK